MTYLTRNQKQAERRARNDAEYDREQEERAAKDEKYRYLPASYRAMDELTEAVGRDKATLILALVEALIAERHDS